MKRVYLNWLERNGYFLFNLCEWSE